MTRLTDAAPQFDEPTWRRAQRAAALVAAGTLGPPDLDDDVWKYAPLADLDLDALELASATGDGPVCEHAGAVALVTLVAGRLDAVEVRADGVGVGVGADAPAGDLGRLVGPDDLFAALNLAHTPGPVVVDVAPRARVAGPVVLEVRCPDGASFPRVLVRVGEDASVRVLEHVSGSPSLVAGVAEYVVGDGATLEVCTVQTLDVASWSIARTRASLGRGARLVQTVVGLGAHYDRVRADALLEGDGAESVLHTAHVGTGSQVHDLRTMQVHRGRRTVARLRSKAAVTDHAGSVYSGLIAMRHGAKGADASQVNTSLVLSDDAHADAVPNLDIEENDVRCTHASSVGPVDAEQRWYLESRGVPPADAVRLILEGFFADVEALVADATLVADLRASIAALETRVAEGATRGTA